jgi:hypothetical protein
MNLGVLRLKIRTEPYSRKREYEWGNNAADWYGGFRNEKKICEDSAPDLDR